jgi:3-oxoacyl-[acyl-carrier protein] reductase
LADVSKLEEVEKMVGEIKKEFGKLDVLVNNAGICQEELWQK